jgi:Pyruvate/2-oxoacid:ferredoxin oxidoreductase delta subunit
MIDFGEALVSYRPPINTRTVRICLISMARNRRRSCLNFITPHQKWGIHSTYTDNLHMLTLSRGGPIVWVSEVDAKKIDVKDNDWLEVFNTNGAIVARAVVSQRVNEGMMLMYHAQEKLVHTPGSKITNARGGIHNSVTRATVKPTHMIGGYAQLAYGFNYYGTVGSNRDEFVIVRRMDKVDWMDEPAKMEAQNNESTRTNRMVLNLDKCIGCHTCSVTCKNVWTSREGVEYAWFNNVETKPGVGYPKEWENQKKWNGGWKRHSNGKIHPKQGSRWRILANIFGNPNLPEIDDYYEPFTFDYDHLAKSAGNENHAYRASAFAGDRRAHGKNPMGAKLGRNSGHGV